MDFAAVARVVMMGQSPKCTSSGSRKADTKRGSRPTYDATKNIAVDGSPGSLLSSLPGHFRQRQRGCISSPSLGVYFMMVLDRRVVAGRSSSLVAVSPFVEGRVCPRAQIDDVGPAVSSRRLPQPPARRVERKKISTAELGCQNQSSQIVPTAKRETDDVGKGSWRKGGRRSGNLAQTHDDATILRQRRQRLLGLRPGPVVSAFREVGFLFRAPEVMSRATYQGGFLLTRMPCQPCQPRLRFFLD